MRIYQPGSIDNAAATLRSARRLGNREKCVWPSRGLPRGRNADPAVVFDERRDVLFRPGRKLGRILSFRPCRRLQPDVPLIDVGPSEESVSGARLVACDAPMR